jgi:DNA-binding transcriptional regulator YhcF (GntR family)
MPRPRIVTDERRTELLRVAIARRQLPSDKQLAQQCGVSVRAIHRIMRELVRDCVLSCDASQQHDPHA